MTTVKELRELCDQLYLQRTECLKAVLNDYFESCFILKHRPWRAVLGNKRCKPIPIHRNVSFSKPGQEDHLYKEHFQWPNCSEEAIRKELTNLGFVVTGPYIAISVPPCEKGKKLSFAQEWVKKINYSYSVYCKNEQELAPQIYSEFLSNLSSVSPDQIESYEEYTLFCNFKYEERRISPICYTNILKLMEKDGISELYENDEYKGIKVLRHPPN